MDLKKSLKFLNKQFQEKKILKKKRDKSNQV